MSSTGLCAGRGFWASCQRSADRSRDRLCSATFLPRYKGDVATCR
jgi:hypothetical protein